MEFLNTPDNPQQTNNASFPRDAAHLNYGKQPRQTESDTETHAKWAYYPRYCWCCMAKLSVITTDMLYTTAVLQAPRLIRGMMHGSDENRRVRWGEKRGWMDGGKRAARGWWRTGMEWGYRVGLLKGRKDGRKIEGEHGETARWEERAEGWRHSGGGDEVMEGWGWWLLSCIDLLQSGMAGRVMKCGIWGLPCALVCAL